MNAYLKIRLKLFFIHFIFELIVNSTIMLIAWFSDMIIETLSFYIAWRAFRTAVPKMFHFKASKNPFVNICGCAVCSILCFIIAIRLMLPINISMFSGVIVGIFINYCLYKIQDYLDLKKEIAKETINIYKMTEDELRIYARSKQLPEMMIDTLVLKVIHNYKWVEIQHERNYSKTAIIYHKKQICKVLNIEL